MRFHRVSQRNNSHTLWGVDRFDLVQVPNRVAYAH